MEHLLDISLPGCRIVAARTDALAPPDAFEEALGRVSEHRREKVMACRRDKDRRLGLLAGLLLDDLLIERGLRERDMAYDEGLHGKPSFRGHDDLFFSLAHSGAMAVAALGDAPVGVDVERLEGYPRHIADPYAWTAMEAVGKVTGDGVGELVDSLGGASALKNVALADVAVPEGFSIIHREVDGHLICICHRQATIRHA